MVKNKRVIVQKFSAWWDRLTRKNHHPDVSTVCETKIDPPGQKDAVDHEVEVSAHPNPDPASDKIQNNAPAISITEQDTGPQAEQPKLLIPTLVEAIQENIDAKPPRISCWAQAAEALKKDTSSAFKKLRLEDDHKYDPTDLLRLTEAKKKKDKYLSPWVERSIRSVLQFKDLIAAAVSLDPYKCAPFVWKTTCVVLEACINVSNLNRAFVKDLASITSMLSYWANAESFYLGATNRDTEDKFQNLEAELVQLNIAILNLQVELVGLMDDGPVWRVFIMQERADTWKRLNEVISAQHSNCKNTFEGCKMVIDQQGKIKDWISTYQRKNAHNTALQRTGVEEKYRMCGQWFLGMQEFENWSSGHPEHKVLWLRGTSGTGKTTLLARTIQWQLDRTSLFRDRRLVYFYCVKDQPAFHSYIAVLHALLRQASFDHATGEVFEGVRDAYKNAGGNSQELKPMSFTQCKVLLGKIVKSGVKLRIIVDALDECDDPKALLKELRDAAAGVSGGIELLVSSRYEVRVDEKFPTAVEVGINSSISEVDMISYITTEIKDREDDERLLKCKHPELEDQLIEILRKRAGGMFRWVELQLSFFLNSRPPLAHQLTVRKHLDSLNTKTVAGEKDLNDAYDVIFDRNTAENEIERTHASKLYRTLLGCWGPFSMSMAINALKLDGSNNMADEDINGYARFHC